MPKAVDPVVGVEPEKPKRTKAEREAAKAARQAARPVREHPQKGEKKPAANKGGKLNPKAKVRSPEELTDAVPVEGAPGCYRISGRLDPVSGVSEWIILPDVASASL